MFSSFMFETFIRHFLFSFSLKSMSEKVCQIKRGWQQGVPRGNISGHQDLHWGPGQEDCHIPHLIWGGGHHFWWWRWISGCNKTLHDYNQETSYSNNQWWVKLAVNRKLQFVICEVVIMGLVLCRSNLWCCIWWILWRNPFQISFSGKSTLISFLLCQISFFVLYLACDCRSFWLFQEDVSSYLQLLCLAENMRTDSKDLSCLLDWNRCDIRQSLLHLQFWACSGGGQQVHRPLPSSGKDMTLKMYTKTLGCIS